MLDLWQDWLEGWQRFWKEMAKTYDPPEWSLENNTIWSTNNLKLLQFQGGNKDPVFVVPPNAGHHSNIAEKLISLTMEYDMPVYAIEWLSAKEWNYSIADMVSDIHTCTEKIGQPAHFFSLCQGAWASIICLSLFPDCALSYTNAAGPINFNTKDGKIDHYTQSFPMHFFQSMVAMGGGVQPGEFQVMGFKNLNPFERWWGDYLDLWRACQEQDTKKIEKYHRFKRWYEYSLNLAGKWYLEAVKKLFKENRLYLGNLEILGQKINVNIPHKTFLIAGKDDDITLPHQVFDLRRKTNTKEEFLIEKTGHIGVFTSGKSTYAWRKILSQLN